VSKARIPRAKAREIMELVGRLKGSVLYWVLKVAVPQIKGEMTVDREGCVGGILGVVIRCDVVASSQNEMYM
jgi:hypothetical protein